jgi:hypothetical protein
VDQYAQALNTSDTRPNSWQLLHQVYRLYRESLGTWLAITTPASLTAAVVLLITDQKVREIFGRLPRGGDMTLYPLEIAGAGVIRFGGFFLAWLLGCFALGAIATVVLDAQHDDPEVPWVSDSYQRVRERVLPILFVAVVTFIVFLVGLAAVLLVDVVVAIYTGGGHLRTKNISVVLLGYIFVASIVSWFGAAIPLLLRETLSGWQALKLSLGFSRAYKEYLFLLVLESVAGSYAAALAVRHGLVLLIPPGYTYSGWFPWLVFVLTSVASAAVQPPMFIGFSLIADCTPRIQS